MQKYEVATKGFLALPFHLAMTRHGFAEEDRVFGWVLDWFLRELSNDFHSTRGEERRSKGEVLNAVYALRRAVLRQEDLEPIRRHMHTIRFRKMLNHAYPAAKKHRLNRAGVRKFVEEAMQWHGPKHPQKKRCGRK